MAMQPSAIQLSIQKVRKSFAGKGGEVRVLDDLSFEIKERDFVSVIGPSGCGKTTIFNIIAGLLEPDSGTLHYRGEEIENLWACRLHDAEGPVVSLAHRTRQCAARSGDARR
jgi:NitT/TauT family transport system ATP-binding protein